MHPVRLLMFLMVIVGDFVPIRPWHVRHRIFKITCSISDGLHGIESSCSARSEAECLFAKVVCIVESGILHGEVYSLSNDFFDIACNSTDSFDD